MNQKTANPGQIQRILFFSLVIVLVSQLNINLFVTNFKISIAVIFFALFLFLLKDFPLLSVTFISGIGVYLSRVLYYWFINGSFGNAWMLHFPECIFYISYGVLLYFYAKFCHYDLKQANALLPIFFIDYFANFAELFLRLQFRSLNGKAQASILLVALLRVLLIWLILTLMNQYKFSLLKKEHALRYQRLMLLISKLNGEVLWMKKNTVLMEQTMHTAYQLYGQLQAREEDSELAQSALHTAKDIHEIKKEYLLILRGLSEALDINLLDEGMYISELFLVLKNSLSAEAVTAGRVLHLDIQGTKNLYTDKHYFLLSVLRNLFSNAIEASIETDIFITVRESLQEDGFLFAVTDSGPGISPDSLPQIFDPGFSTKINFATGEINRGLGLNLVKDIVEIQFHGSIKAVSTPGNTTFYILLPVSELEVL